MNEDNQTNQSKKIIIVEDDESVAKSLSRLLTSHGFETKTLLYHPKDILKSGIDFSYLNLEENKPDYVIIDGLQGDWKDMAPMVEPYDACPIIFSANEYVIKAAKDRGFNAFDKPGQLEEMIEFMKKEKF